MKVMFFVDRYFFLEKQVHEYMKVLVVKTPEQVLHYFEKQLMRYQRLLLLQNLDAYPDSVITSIHYLIKDYSSAIHKVQTYLSYQKELQLLNN